MTDPSPTQLLSLPLPQPNDADATDVRDYLLKLLEGVWREEEGFDGKRPFGNSSWQHDIYSPMVRAGMIAGDSTGDDDYPYPAQGEQEKADEMILAAIDALRMAVIPGDGAPREPKTLHPSTVAILRYYEFSHLPPHLARISAPFREVAREMAATLDGPELTAGLRKLLEAKDCFVRAALP